MFALTLTLGMGTRVYAAEGDHTITITNESNDEVGKHTYEAYQVFTGELVVKDGKKVLSNIDWGNGVNGNAVLNAVKEDTETFGDDAANVKNAADVAKLLGNFADESPAAKKFAAIVGEHLGTIAGQSIESKAPYTISVTGDGYYFVKDSATLPSDTDPSEPHKGDAQTRYILQVVADVSVGAKTGTVESKKKVQDINDSTESAVGSLQDSADYDIGDNIPYTLTFKLPHNYTDYKTYAVSFVDDISAGLTFNEDAKIYYGATDNTGESITFTKSGMVWTAEIADLKALTSEKAKALTNDDVITIKYTAKLNERAVIGSAGNPNTYHVVYSNNPNGTGTGTTPEDKNIVFTYQVTVNKIDPAKEGTDKSLKGANFTLYKKVVQDADGNYPQGSDTGANFKKGFAPNVKADALVATDHYIVVSNRTGDATGSTFTFKGIDDGTYVLVETTIPAGYNAWDAVKFDVVAEHQTDAAEPQLTKLTGGDLVSGDFKDTGIIITSIENKSGSTLPSTGGIGTTIFYVLGGLLVAGAGIVLVARKKAAE